jgi:biopolymer transport protein ExbB
MKRMALGVALAVGAGSTALAVDLPTPAPVPSPLYPPAVGYNWTGFYIGGNLGVGWNGGSFSDSIGNTLSLNPQTLFSGGAQVGFNYEFGSGILVGAEANFDWLSNTTSSSNTIVLQNPTGTPTASTASLSANNRWLTTVVGRLGYAWDRILFYGKGGGAWVRSNTPSLTMDGAPVAISTSNGNWGFAGGVGIEWAFSGNWSARFEYDFVGLNQTFTLPTSAGGLPAGDQFTGNTRNIQLVNAVSTTNSVAGDTITRRQQCEFERHMHRSKIIIVLVTGLLLTAQVSAFAQDDRSSSGGASPAPAAEAADAPAKAATPSSETSIMKGSSANPSAGEPSLSLAQLPQDLSPWGMFLHADTIVKAVMIGLAVASLVTWTVWVAKSIELFGARATVRHGLRILASATTLAQAHEKLRKGTGPVAQLLQAAANEIRLSVNLHADGLKERIAWQSERIEMAAGRKISRGTGVLATIGATAPFVGLFGTVWGIMDSFIGISKAHTTNLAVVAPGIAEALLATALGLVAAIPAVMIYNVLARRRHITAR